MLNYAALQLSLLAPVILYLWLQARLYERRYRHLVSLLDLKASKDAVNQIEKTMVTKNDKAFSVLAGAMQDALSQGQGLFLIRKMKDGSYLWRVDEKDVHIDQKEAVS